ncbi:UDP-N-acetylmuramoyl-L-alanine--D-glutamate ligase [Candidatus Sororendozoicomonas aggregata]|uniref:UDP-N-acetylmuramoyl-L-alanine--D-glutamate ligase n=1 Tax=Candidatus Sororendozoicomonas aggregata TaxID=3073239 RepID=UPI002ED1B387
MALIGSSCKRVIVGLGNTGLSCARYLSAQGLPFSVVDSRLSPPGLAALRDELPDVMVHTGSLDEQLLAGADELIVSPGIAVDTPAIAAAAGTGAKVIGDIELFCRAVTNKPVIAITGSNGKSTVTTLVGDMAREAGICVAVGGNIGIPALELLKQRADLYILELSSFQLETTDSLRAVAATILNMSPDHMDRYSSMAAYHAAKQKIYRGCQAAIVNRDDSLSMPLLPSNTPCTFFTARSPDLQQYGLQRDDQGTWLCKGPQRLLNATELRVFGRHNHLNALAALALGEAAGINEAAMLRALRCFRGLRHRCQWVAEGGGVQWFNDSKATNVGASVAAIEGLGKALSGQLVLIAGGDGKGADFSELLAPAKRYVRHVVLLGRDSPRIKAVIEGQVPYSCASSLAEAVTLAANNSVSGDAVLLAPACASFDMFNSFEHRGDQFIQCVQQLLQEPHQC